jgi:hypothetical protein
VKKLWLLVKRLWWLPLAGIGFFLLINNQAERESSTTGSKTATVVQTTQDSTQIGFQAEYGPWLLWLAVIFLLVTLLVLLYKRPARIWKKESLWVSGVLLFALALIYGLSIYEWNMHQFALDAWKNEWQGIPMVVLVIGLLAAGLMIYYADPKDIRATMIILAAILFFIAVYELYRHDEISIGQRRDFGYLLVAALGWMIAKYLNKDYQKIAAALLLALTFTLLGFSNFLPWRDFSTHLPEWAGGPPPSTNRVVISTETPQCSRNWVPVVLTPSRATQINKDGACKSRIKHP